MFEIEHLCNAESFVAIFSHWALETSLCSLRSVVAWSFCARWVYERAETGAGLETRWTREPDTRLALWTPTSTTRWLGSSDGAPLLDWRASRGPAQESSGDGDEAGATLDTRWRRSLPNPNTATRLLDDPKQPIKTASRPDETSTSSIF